MTLPFLFSQSEPRRGRRIAVIGSGISGLSAAWLLSSSHRVTVYEKEDWAGGHSHTVEVEGPSGPIPVDTGFIVYNAPNYPNLHAMLAHLGVPTKATDMSFAASLDDGRFEYSSRGPRGLTGQWANLLRPRFWRMLAEIMRFYPQARELADAHHLDGVRLDDFLKDAGYSTALIDDHVVPMCAAIWSTTPRQIREFPVRAFLRFFTNHGLFEIGKQHCWQTIDGGSREYVARLRDGLSGGMRLSSGAVSVKRDRDCVWVEDSSGRIDRFDDVVIATHADQALQLLSDPSPEERSILGAFRYTDNHAVLHTDPSLMPRSRRVWSSWNFIDAGSADAEHSLCVTYWMNRLQGLEPSLPLFVTLNPSRQPNPRSVLGRYDYAHPLFDIAAIRAQSALWSLQGQRRSWFCGSYFGYGFHEDGLQAGLAVAETLGGVRRPWQVERESGRISLPTNQLEAAE